MYQYDVLALDRAALALSAVRPLQCDMAYWRKTRMGISFERTIACPAGWLCLLGTFQDKGLQLIASSIDQEWGFVPTITGVNRQKLVGYAAVGFVFQEKPSNDTASAYGRHFFSLAGRSPFDAKFNVRAVESNPKQLVIQRMRAARTQMDIEKIVAGAATAAV